MTANKEKIIHFSLLVVAAFAVLWYLFRSRSTAAAATVAANPVASVASNFAQYPAAPSQIKLGDVKIEQAPLPYLNYNAPPSDAVYGAEIGEGPNGCGCNGEAGAPVNYPTVAAPVVSASLANYNSALAKFGVLPVAAAG